MGLGDGVMAAPGCGAALPSAGCRSVPDSGGEEPPIRALIQVGLAGLAARSRPDSAADS